MTDRPIYSVPAEDVPGLQNAADADQVFTVNVYAIRDAIDAVLPVYDNGSDEERTLADAIRTLGAEVQSLALGIESGRIAITRE